MIYACTVCGVDQQHDEDVDGLLSELPEGATCPQCGNDIQENYRALHRFYGEAEDH